LKDLDELKDELTEEIRETRFETMEELNEFRVNLERMVAGDMTLLGPLEAVRLATMAAINEAFKTPEVIRLFSTHQTEQLRLRLSRLKEALHLKQISQADYDQKTLEILTALRSLNEPLSDDEASYLSRQMQRHFSGFQESTNSVSQTQQATLISKFGTQARRDT
jgi:hypothetical protein